MKKAHLERLQEILDEKFQQALETDKRMGNNTDNFLPNNPDFIFYKGMLEAIAWLGINHSRESGKHILSI